jgi:hypothetical protein
VTQSLLRTIFKGDELTEAAKVDFGIDSPAHFFALRNAVLSGEVDAPRLDAILGDGKELTAMVNRLNCNPQCVTFKTAYDELFSQYQRDRAGEKHVEAPYRKRERSRQPDI